MAQCMNENDDDMEKTKSISGAAGANLVLDFTFFF
jgi:hypothetical protein